MDLNDIQRKAHAAREYTVGPVQGMTFRCRLPTQYEVELEVARCRMHQGADDPAMLLRVRRALVEKAIVEWQGVTLEHLAPGGGTDAAELVPGAAAYLLDQQPDVADELMNRFVTERAARLERAEAAAKN